MPIYCATRRAITSAGPPGGNGRISRIVRPVWDDATDHASTPTRAIVNATGKQIRRCHCMRLLPKAPVQTTSRCSYTPVPFGRIQRRIGAVECQPTMTLGLADALIRYLAALGFFNLSQAAAQQVMSVSKCVRSQFSSTCAACLLIPRLLK